MFHKIIFYNNFNAGDLFTAREFVRELKNNLNIQSYFAHKLHPSLLDDVIEFTELTSYCDPHKSFNIHDGTLYFNTWIGRDSSYVLPGITCRLDMFRKLYNDILNETGVDYQLKRSYDEYIPTIDYSNINLNIPDKNRKLVLISNGPVFSSQAFNFDFDFVTYQLCEKYKDILFFATKKFNYAPNNLIYTDDLTKKLPDLKEISYLSRFVDIIIGRSSGPYVYCQVKENYLESKKFMSFTYKESCAHMPLSKVKASLYWSDVMDVNSVIERIEQIL